MSVWTPTQWIAYLTGCIVIGAASAFLPIKNPWLLYPFVLGACFLWSVLLRTS